MFELSCLPSGATQQGLDPATASNLSLNPTLVTLMGKQPGWGEIGGGELMDSPTSPVLEIAGQLWKGVIFQTHVGLTVTAAIRHHGMVRKRE